jgi:hypothetical protein
MNLTRTSTIAGGSSQLRGVTTTSITLATGHFVQTATRRFS